MNNEATIGKGLRQYGCCYRAERQCLLILEIYGDGPCWYLFISIVLFICLVDARILPAKRELGKRDSRDGGSQTENMIAQTNPPVVTSASSPSDDRDSSHVGATNEPARESGFQIMEESHSEKINVKSAYSEIVSSPDGHFLENWPTLLSKLQCIDLRDSICEARLRYYAVMKLFIRGSKMPPVKHQLQLQYVRPLVLHCINSTPDGLNILALRCLKMLLLFYTDSCQRLAQKISEFTIPKLISNDDPIRQCAVDVYTLFLKFPRNNSTKQGVHYTEAMRSLLASVYHTLKHAVHNSVTDNDLDERLGNVVPELDFNELENAEQLRGVASALDCLCHLLDQYTPTAVIAIPVEELSATIFYGVNCILSKNTTCSRENRHLFQKLFRLFEVMVSVTNIHYAPYSAGTIAIFNRWMEEQCTGVCGIKSCELKSAVYLSLEALARHVGVGSGLHDRFAFLYRTGLANMLSHLKQICVSLFDLEQLFNQVVPVSTVCSSEVFDSCARFLRTSVQRFGNLIPAEQYSMAQMMIWRALFEMRRNGCFTDATVPSRLMLHRLLNTFLLHPHPRCPSLANMAIGLLKMTVDDQNDQIRSLSAEGLTICERITKPLVPCLESISIWDLEVPNTTWSQDEQRCLQWRSRSHELCTVEADAIGEIPCFTFRRIAPLPLNKLAAYLGQSMTGLAMLSFHQPGTYAIYLDVNNHFDPKLIIRDNQNQLSLFTINQEPNGYFWLLLEDIEHAFRTIDHLIRFYMHFRQPLKVPNGDAVFLKRAAVNVGLQFEMCVEHCKKITDLSYFYRAGQLDNVLSRLVCSGDYLLYEDASNQFGCRLYVKWDGNVKEIKPALHNGRLALPVGCSQQHVETVQSFDHWIKALVVGNLDIDNVQLTRPVRVCGDDGPIEFICAVPGQCPPPKLLYQLPYYHGQLKRDAVKLLLNNAGDFLLYMDESDLKLAVGEQSDHGNDDTSYCETTVECSADGYFYLTPVDMPLCKTTVGELINAYKRLAVPITIQKFGENSFTLPALQRGVVRKDINDEIVLEPCNNPSELSYYYGRMSDDDTMKLLRENGDYLLRSNAKGELSVTATWAECLFDIVVEKEKLKGDAYVYKLKKDNANEPDEFVSTVDEWVKSLVRGKVIIDDAVILKKAVKKHNNNNSEQLLIWQLKTLTDRLLELNKKITVEHVYPAINGKTEIADDDLPTLWKTLPSLALPDGAHNHDADFVYFHLPDLSNPNSTVYGVSYVRQIAAKDLREKSNDITRSTVQKSICAVSSSPLYGLLMPKLESISKVYFEQGDFKQTELLAEMYHNINATIDSTTLCGQQPNFGIIDYFLSQSNGWLNGMLLFRIIVRRLSVRELLHTYRHRTLMLFKLVLLEKRIFFNISPVGSLCSNILALISLFPSIGEIGMIDFGMSHSASYSPLLEDSNLKSDEMNSSKEDNDNSLPLNTSNDDNDDDGSGGDGGGGEQTSECKRNSENRHLSNNTIATELPLDAYGFPLAIFTKGSVLHPYLSLPYMDWLESDHVRAYVVGFTNTLFKQKKELFDAMITIDEENGIDIEIPDVRLRRLLVLSAADLRFIDGVLKTAFQDDSSISQFTKWEGGDEWIRFQFSQYLISLLLTAASDDTSYYDDFNAAFVHSYKTTHNFLLWYSGGFHKQMNFPAGHICHGQLNLADFKLRFTHTIESSDQARKLQHALNTTGNFVNQTGKAVGGIFRNIFNHLTSSSTERSNTP
ncbi:Late secretory pathway protein AVL9 -like protein [Trichinella murrelli]|uniref:Late secretory pathway protein AVL9-like protein n=1 Tax=Trichinella murrelli TaxID=144512 RepID=A0A0V0U1H6_9BILA|nr:Late secretory pathway protein AVL9 -like protein [Trichinella murrelli]